MYWYGYGGAGSSARRMFRLGLDKSVPANPHSLGADDLLYTAPAVAAVGGEDFVFGATTKFGTNATVYKIAWDFSPVSSITVPTATVNSRVTVLAGLVYFIDETGKVWARQAANLSTTTAPSWSYRDGTANHSPACADSGGAAGCVAKNLLVEPATAYVYYGDADGHVYCANNTSGGSACPNYPFRPGTSSDVFETSPLLRAGVLVIGATNGNVYFIDRSAGTVFRRYEFGAPVTSISYTFDRTDANSGAFMIATGTAPGRLYQIRRSHVIDPSPGTP
jgi:outer membrane protein assembly factor BamB